MEELGEKTRVERGRHCYHAQGPFRFGSVAKSLGLLHDSEENVCVEGPLVGLVEDDPRVARELRIYIRLALLTKATYVRSPLSGQLTDHGLSEKHAVSEVDQL